MAGNRTPPHGSATQAIRRLPCLSYAAFSVVFFFFIGLLEQAGNGYDDGGIGGWVFALSLLWNVLAFPFYLTSEFLYSLHAGQRVPGHGLIALAIGTAFCALADFALHRRRRARTPGPSPGSPRRC